MTTDDSARHLRRLLAELKASEDLERFARQRREAGRRAGAVRAEELQDALVFPSLRAFAAELEREGHQTRIERLGTRRLRLHVQLQGRRAVAATVESDWELADDPTLEVRVRHQFRDLAIERLPASSCDAERLAELWVRILERLVALATR